MNARRVVADFGVFSRGYIRSRIGAFFALVFPVILILIFGAIFSGGSSGPVSAYVQNQDGSQVSTGFVSALNSTNTIRLHAVDTSQNFTSYLLSHSASDGIVIPSGFSSAFVSGKPVNVTVYGNPASTTSAIVSGITRGVVNQFNLKRAGGSSVIGVEPQNVKSQSLKYIDFLVPGLVGTGSKSVESSAVVGNLVTFPMMFLSGTFFPVSTMPAYLQSFAHVLPLFYVIDGLNNVMTYGNYGAALADLGVLLVLSAIIFGLAVRFFKWRED